MKLHPDSKISKQTPPTAEDSSRIASLFYKIEDLPLSNVLLLSISLISVVSVVLLSLHLSQDRRPSKTSACVASTNYPSIVESFKDGQLQMTTTKSY